MCNHYEGRFCLSFSGVIFRHKVAPRSCAGQRQQATGGNMRLTCPNCGAQYEVPDEVIPETGRDVQCSNCGDTWFQTHPSQQTEEDTEAAEAPHPGWDSPEEETADEAVPEADGSDDVADEPSEPEDEPVPEADEPVEPEVAERGRARRARDAAKRSQKSCRSRRKTRVTRVTIPRRRDPEMPCAARAGPLDCRHSARRSLPRGRSACRREWRPGDAARPWAGRLVR